jgi:hypothetical protein
MTKAVDDILRGFSEVHGTESEKLDWLRARLTALLEEVAAEIEGKLLEDPTYVGKQYNSALKMAAAIVRRKAGYQVID